MVHAANADAAGTCAGRSSTSDRFARTSKSEGVTLTVTPLKSGANS